MRDDNTYPEDRDPIDEEDRDGGEFEDADQDAMDRWADTYDDLNGTPENEGDR